MEIEEIRLIFNRYKKRKATPEEAQMVRFIISQLEEQPNGWILRELYENGKHFEELAGEIPCDITTLFRWNRKLMIQASKLMKNERGWEID